MSSNRIPMSQFILNILLVSLLLAAIGGERTPTVSAAEPRLAPGAAVPGGPGFVMVPATAFIPESPTASYSVFWGELSVPQGSPSPIISFNAPVYLPQGARLTGLTMYYRDSNSDGLTLGVDLRRKLLPSSSSGENVGLSVYSSLVGFNTYESDTTPDLARAVIDNSQYAYWLNLYIYSAPTYLQLQAVRIDYTYSVALPDVHR